MALAATTVWEIRTTGDDSNGGGFDSASSAGTDYSQQDAAQLVIDGATITGVLDGTTTMVLTGYTVATTDEGNTVNVTGGTMTAGHYRIASVNTSLNRWTLDRTAGAIGNTCVGKMGGCKASPGALNGIIISGNNIHVKAGTYTMTTSTAGAAGPVNTGNVTQVWSGYQTTRNDFGTRPVIHAGSISGITMFTTGSSAASMIMNIDINGNSQTGNIGMAMGSRQINYLCEVSNCPGTGGFNAAQGICVRCKATNCSAVGFFSDTYACIASGCGVGFSNSVMYNSRSIAKGCTTGFSLGSGGKVISCVAYGNSGDGFEHGSTSGKMINCISAGNGGYGYDASSLTGRLINCAAYNNTSGNFLTTAPTHIGNITLTADPFTNAAGGDFSLNTTAGGGAVCRGAGIDVIGQTDAADIGAVQHADPASSGGGYYVGVL